MTVDATLTKSLPFQAMMAFSPDTIVTPVVGPEPTTLTLCEVEVALRTIYALLVAGAVIVSRLAGLPVQLMIMYWAEPVAPDPAWLKADPVVVESVTAVWLPLMV
jgi:hypothetical protein